MRTVGIQRHLLRGTGIIPAGVEQQVRDPHGIQCGGINTGGVLQDEMSGADIKAACTEAGLLALRERRMRVTHADFKKAKEKVLYKKKEGVPEGMYM